MLPHARSSFDKFRRDVEGSFRCCRRTDVLLSVWHRNIVRWVVYWMLIVVDCAGLCVKGEGRGIVKRLLYRVMSERIGEGSRYGNPAND
jgi:hypothetical protein